MNKHVKLLLQSLCVAILAFLLSYIVVYDISSLPALSPLERATDIEMSDIYNEVANRRATAYLNKDIVIVSIDGCSREQIASVIDAVSWFEPRAIGLDVMFAYPSDDDESLLSSISSCDNMVLPCHVIYDSEQQAFTEQVGSFFYPDLETKRLGVVNLAINSTHNVVRQFKPTFHVDGIHYDNFSAAIARIADEEKYHKLLDRENELENISYPSIYFEEYAANELIDENGFPILAFKENIHNRIVLIGGTHDLTDMHMVPIDAQMPGLYIHAFALHTILTSSYISSLGEVSEWLLAFFFCYIFSVLNMFIKQDSRWNNIESLGLRLLQILLMYGLLWIGCKWFVSFNQYLDFSFSLVMIGLSALASDIWVGLCDIVEMIVQKCKRNEKSVS